jgi:hypothetical protein
MEDEILSTDLKTIDLLIKYLEALDTSDRLATLTTTIEQDRTLTKIEPALIAMVENLKIRPSGNYERVADGYEGWKKRGTALNYFLANHRDFFLQNLIDFRIIYVEEARTKIFKKKLMDMTGTELNIYLQIIGILK